MLAIREATPATAAHRPRTVVPPAKGEHDARPAADKASLLRSGSRDRCDRLWSHHRAGAARRHSCQGEHEMKVKNILRAIARFTRAKQAVSALEYAIVVGVVVAGVGGAVVAFTGVLEDQVKKVGDQVKATAQTTPSANLTPSP